ncbi:MAG: hypothetical protein PHO02_01105 [Candidatus Nanoarchaeia archaeon]|nr:hypothetical protein [Candidatus Nanoarchaeia archaeon]
MNRTSIDEWNELTEVYSDSAHRMNKQFRDKWGEIANTPQVNSLVKEKIADLYIDVPVECPQLRDSLLLGADSNRYQPHFKELPEPITQERPALHLTCNSCVYQLGNPGWHNIVLAGYAKGREPVREEMLWHKDSLKHRGGLLAKIREMAKQMAEMPEY